MSGQGHAVNEAAVRAGFGDTEPDLKRRRLLGAWGPIQDDETAKQKMRDAKVRGEMRGDITGFDPEEMGQKKYAWCSDGLITPMGHFAQQGDLPMMRWLYANGADTRDEDVEHWFPMYAASHSGQLDACKWLFDHGADNDVKRRTSNDVSSLCVTFDKCYWRDTSRWLILMGALCKDDGSSDLDLRVMRKDQAVLQSATYFSSGLSVIIKLGRHSSCS